MSEKDDGLYLTDMWDATTKIEEYIGTRSFEDFLGDDKTYDAVMRQLSVLGEAANNVSSELRAKYPEIPWFNIVGMRNRLMHEYSNIEKDIVWSTCMHDLPILKEKLKEINEI